MAVTYVGGATNNTASNSQLAVSVHASAQEGDIMVAYMFAGQNTSTTTFSANNGDWWFPSVLSGGDAGGRDRSWAVAFKYVANNEPSSHTFTASAGTRWGCVIDVYRGGHPFFGLDVTPTASHSNSGTNNTTPTNPAITTNTNGAMVHLMHGSNLDDITAGGAPTNYTLGSQINGGTLDDRHIHTAYREITTAGTETPGAWTHTSSPTNQAEWHVATIAIMPDDTADNSITRSSVCEDAFDVAGGGTEVLDTRTPDKGSAYPTTGVINSQWTADGGQDTATDPDTDGWVTHNVAGISLASNEEDPGNDDYYSLVKTYDNNATVQSANFVGAIVRMDPTTGTTDDQFSEKAYYAFYIDQEQADWELRRHLASDGSGQGTVLDSGNFIPYGLDNEHEIELRVEVVNTDDQKLTCLFDGYLVTEYTDTNAARLTSRGRPAMYAQRDNNVITYWESGVEDAAASLAGTNTLSLTPAGSFSVGYTLNGTNTLSLTPAATTFLASAVLAGSAAMSLTPAGTFAKDSPLAGANTLSLTPAASSLLASAVFDDGGTTLSLTPAGSMLAGYTLNGDNTVSLTPAGSMLVGVTLDGTNTLSLTPAGTFSVGVKLDGDNTLSLTPAGTFAKDNPLSGSNTLSLTPAASSLLASAYFGDGATTVSLTPTGTFAKASSFSGANTLTLTPAASSLLASALFGDGATTLTLTPAGTFAATAILNGTNTLSLTPAGTFAAGGDFQLNGTNTLTLTPAASSLLASAVLNGDNTLSLTPAGTFAKDNPLAGSNTLTLTPAASSLLASALFGDGATTLNLTPAGTFAVGSANNLQGDVTLNLIPAGTFAGPQVQTFRFDDPDQVTSYAFDGESAVTGGRIDGSCSITFSVNGTFSTDAILYGSNTLNLTPAGTFAALQTFRFDDPRLYPEYIFDEAIGQPGQQAFLQGTVTLTLTPAGTFDTPPYMPAWVETWLTPEATTMEVNLPPTGVRRRRSGGGWVDLTIVKRREGGVWVDATINKKG